MPGYVPSPGNKSRVRDGYHVSKSLRSSGFKIGYNEDRYKRDGVYVQNWPRMPNESMSACVGFSFDSKHTDCRKLFEEIRDKLKDLGFEVEPEWDDEYPRIYVSKLKPEDEP